MLHDYFQRKAIEAVFNIRPKELQEIFDGGNFDNNLIENIGGTRCLLPIYYITKLWDLALNDGTWNPKLQPQLDEANKRNGILKEFWKEHYAINLDELSIDFSLYACDYQEGDIVLFGRDDIEDMKNAGTPDIDIDLYRSAMLFNYAETERLLQKGADGQAFYNFDERKFDVYFLDMPTRFYDIAEEIGTPFSDNTKINIPKDIMLLMEMCALKKMIDLLEKYGAHYVSEYDEYNEE